MTLSGFTTEIFVDKTAAEVFSAINNVRGWWSEEIEGETANLNGEFDYHYQDVHRCKMKIIESVANKRVVWQVLNNFFSFTKDKTEWKGNTIVFEISEKDNKTRLQFIQEGLVPQYECYDICQNAWTTYIQKSLFSLITTGKGQPNGKDKPQTEDEKRLGTPNFTSSFFVDQTPAEVFNAVNNVRGWWQGEIEGSTDKLNDQFTYRMKEFHFSKQKVVSFHPFTKIEWLVTDSKLNFLGNKAEWTGTKLSFEIAEINNKTQLRFTHVGLVPDIECYTSCSNGWSKLIQESLFSLVTTGKGTKVF